MLHRPLIMAGLLALALASGCTRQIVQSPNPLEIDAREYDRVYHAAQLVLRQQGFVLARQDHRFGVISTRSLPAPWAIEVWNGTSTTLYQRAESTFNTERRVVTVMLEKQDQAVLQRLASQDAPADVPATQPATTATAPAPDDGGRQVAQIEPAGTYVLRVEVLVQRQELPLMRFTGSTTAGYMKRSLTAVPAEWQERGIQGSYWQTISRDPYLEQRLIAQIIRKSIKL